MARLISILEKLQLYPLTKGKLIKMGFLFLVYFATARLGASIFVSSSHSALIWPPAGIAMASLFLGGYGLWPAVALGSILNNIVSELPWVSTLGIAIANTGQALLGSYILKRLGFDKKFNRFKDTALIFLVGFIVTMFAPTIGLLFRALSEGSLIGVFSQRWVTWWLGCVLSVIVLTPLITSWAQPLRITNRKRFAESSLAMMSLLVIEYLIFWQGITNVVGISLVYILLIPLFWIGLRFGPKYITVAILLTAVSSIVGILYGPSEISQEIIGQRLVQIEIFTIIISLIYYILSSISEERRQAEVDLERHVFQLEEALEMIRRHALHDTLTGLPNRKALEERFEVAKSMAKRHNHKLAVLFLDLDRFKNVNDTLGHSIGDLILQETAARLSGVVRDMDTVARLGGDEFIIILNELTHEDHISTVVEKIMDTFRSPISILEDDFHISTSIGIAVYPEAGDDMNKLLRSADIALYQAKEKGRQCYKYFDQEMQNRLHAKLSLEKDLRVAIEKQQLELVYQPCVDLKTDQTLGVEALVRWNHPTLGLLYPGEFIPLAEESGLILKIGNWLIKRACKQLRDWKNEGMNISVAINLSAKQLVGVGLVERISTTLENYDIDPKFLELEVTESVAMQNLGHSHEILKQLSDLGICITMDDFGTGYSSLSYLKSFYVHKIKIDQSFVKDMTVDPQDATIVRTIISMGHALGLVVCAEGIENSDQKMLLNSMGCDKGQGYFICHPLNAAKMTEFMKARATYKEIV